MIAEVTSAALMSENKQMAHPASVDSTPTSANQEDHVSMACHGARLLPMTENLFAILGIEALSAIQGVELRGPLKTSRNCKGDCRAPCFNPLAGRGPLYGAGSEGGSGADCYRRSGFRDFG